MKSIVIKNVKDTNVNDFYYLIVDNFNANEIEEKEELLKNAKKFSNDYKISYLTENNKIVAFALYFIFEDVIYLEYLVSDKNYRKMGYAFKLVQNLTENFTNIIIAVDNENNENYYKKIGAVELDFVFKCPPLGDGKKIIGYKLLCINYKYLTYKKLKNILNIVFDCYENAKSFINSQFCNFVDEDLVKISH
ncbi:MAG: GNAT family N-acetyltransferase [Lachnospiraceae bacterium]|nr:GNAT family N-acetyltransferase [Lachnospiraceae bacterium]